MFTPIDGGDVRERFNWSYGIETAVSPYNRQQEAEKWTLSNLHLYHQVFQLYNVKRQFVLSLRLCFSVHRNQNMALNMMRLVRLLM